MHRNWKIPTTLPLTVVLAFAAAGALAQPADPLATLRKQHPRLIALDSDIARIRKLIATDPLVKESYDGLRLRADQLLSQPPVEYVLSDRASSTRAVPLSIAFTPSAWSIGSTRTRNTSIARSGNLMP
jgi:hypothetical protein